MKRPAPRAAILSVFILAALLTAHTPASADYSASELARQKKAYEENLAGVDKGKLLPKGVVFVKGYFKTNFVTEGSQLCVVHGIGTDLPMEYGKSIQLKSHDTSKLINDLNDLTGYVKIDSPQKALEYVRLRTSFATWYMWSKTPLVMEIVGKSQLKSIPNFGFYSFVDSYVHAGFGGEIAESKMKQAGVWPATVQPYQQKYHIRRWLLTRTRRQSLGLDRKAEYTLQQVEETVDVNGAYAIRVVKQVPANRIPYDPRQIYWYIPAFQ